MASNSSCPLCTLEHRDVEPYTAFESQQEGVAWVSCLGCNRSAPQIPHHLRLQLFRDLTQPQRLQVAAMVENGRQTYEDAIRTVLAPKS